MDNTVYALQLPIISSAYQLGFCLAIVLNLSKTTGNLQDPAVFLMKQFSPFLTFYFLFVVIVLRKGFSVALGPILELTW